MSLVREDQLLIVCSRVYLDQATKKKGSALLCPGLHWDCAGKPKREAALKLPKTKLVQRNRAWSEIGADLRIIGFSPEDLLLYLGARLAPRSNAVPCGRERPLMSL